MPDLPAHIAFAQSLQQTIVANLSDSSANKQTLAQLCQRIDLSLESLLEVELSYAPLQGSELLRSEIIRFHEFYNQSNISLTPENVITFVGAQEALQAIYSNVLSMGDEVVMLTPSYPSLFDMALACGAKLNAINVIGLNRQQIATALVNAINENTRLVVINSPHNPSGFVIDSSLAVEILTRVKKYDCYLLSDDVSQASNYLKLPLTHTFLTYEKAIIVSVLSKSLGLPGIRVGWALSPNKWLIEQLLTAKCYGSICNSRIDETLATHVLANHQPLVAENNRVILKNIALFERFVAANIDKLSWQAPVAGILALVEVKNVGNIEQWIKALVRETGILVYPVNVFLPEMQQRGNLNYFRLGLGQASFAEHLSSLQLFLDQY